MTIAKTSIGSYLKVHACVYTCSVEYVNDLTGTPVMTEEVMGLVDDLYEMRLESLLSVQDLVEAVVKALDVRHLTN